MGKETRLELASRVRHQLEESFARVMSGQNLHQLSTLAEQLLAETISHEILEEIALAVKRKKNKKLIVIAPNLFQFGNEVYELRIGLAASSGRGLDVVIDRRKGEQRQLMGAPLHLRIEVVGRIKEIRVQLPTTFDAQRDTVGAIVKSVLETGYRLLGAQIENSIETIQKGPAHELYGHLRGLLPIELARAVKFNAIADSQGVYLLDREAFNSSVQTVEEQHFLTCRSALEVVTDVCTTLVPFDEMFSKTALSQNRSLDADLRQAKYAPRGTHLSEMALYGSDHAVVLPLSHEEKTSLVASYPADFRSLIEPVLCSDRHRFEQLAKTHSEGLRATLDLVANQAKRPVARVLESGTRLLAGFAGAYTAELIHHL